MATFKAKTMGKEQLILLPTDSHVYNLSPQVKLNTGLHSIVASGYAGIYDGGTSKTALTSGYGFMLVDVDDDDVWSHDVEFFVGPLWRRVSQVSASVSPAGIYSADSDEVDHSRWVLKGCTWDVIDVSGGKKIQLNVQIDTMGDRNGWVNYAYQVIATGDLRRLPEPDEISADLS